MLTFKELRHFMTKFFDDIESAIKGIHINHGVDNDTVTKEIAQAITTNVEPLKQQLTDQQTQIEELQQALQDTVAAIKSGDTDAALATATAATNGTGSSNAGSGAAGAGEGDAGEGDESGAGQATS